MSWFSYKSHLKTEKSCYEQESSKSIQSIETQVLMNIESIQKFYNLNSQKKLIDIILDKKQSERLFQREQLVFSSLVKDDHQSSQQKEQKRIRFFAQKYTYQALVDKFPKPKSGTNELLLRILQVKMEKSVITSHQTRKNIWLLASGAKFNMINNKDLFENLLKYHDYPKYFQRAIIQDLHRTVNKTTSFSIEEDILKLKNVLIAFSRRNPYIGYCQGLNFIAFFLLTMQFTEEQAFFLLSTMLESIIPMDYYTNMIGVVCDQQIFINILRVIKPHIAQKFDEVGLDPSVLSIQWFVCLFASSLPFYLVKIVWDRLLVEGTRAFIKTGLIILTYFEDAIMQANEFHEIIMILQKGTKNLHVPETVFNAQFQKYYIDKKGLKIARDLYREYHIKEKLSQKVIARKNKITHPKCNTKWPICVAKLQRLRRQREEIDVWVYRPENPPKIIHDYLSNKPKNFNKKVNITATFIDGLVNGQKNRSLVHSFRSLHEDPANEVLEFMSKTTKKTTNYQKTSEVHDINGSYNAEEDSENRVVKKIQYEDIPVPKKIQNKRSSELIIGRMNHICHKQAIQMQKMKKIKRSQIKFLSMMFDDSQQPKPDERRAETYKKIQQACHILSNEEDIIENLSQTKPQHQQTNGASDVLARQQRELLAQSRAVNFYNEFIQNNKELSSILGGTNNYDSSKQRLEEVADEYQSENTSQNDDARKQSVDDRDAQGK